MHSVSFVLAKPLPCVRTCQNVERNMQMDWSRFWPRNWIQTWIMVLESFKSRGQISSKLKIYIYKQNLTQLIKADMFWMCVYDIHHSKPSGETKSFSWLLPFAMPLVLGAHFQAWHAASDLVVPATSDNTSTAITQPSVPQHRKMTDRSAILRATGSASLYLWLMLSLYFTPFKWGSVKQIELQRWRRWQKPE